MGLTAQQKEELLRALFPDCEFSLRGVEITSWRGPWDPPTDEDLIANADRVEAFRLEKEKQKRKAYLADARWRAETGGLTLPDGTVIKTDRESQALLTAAAFSAMVDPETTIMWKGTNGWIALTPQEVLQIAGLVRQHVQACFSREHVLAELVDKATTIEEVLAVEW